MEEMPSGVGKNVARDGGKRPRVGWCGVGSGDFNKIFENCFASCSF
jgi:hypothetical protein